MFYLGVVLILIFVGPTRLGLNVVGPLTKLKWASVCTYSFRSSTSVLLCVCMFVSNILLDSLTLVISNQKHMIYMIRESGVLLLSIEVQP